MQFYDQAGLAALGSRMRRLSEVLGQQARGAYPIYGVDLDPRWFPAFYFVAGQPGASVSEVAAGIGQSHAAVSQVARKLEAAGLLQRSVGSDDGRTSTLTLTSAGMQLVPRLREQCADADRAVRELLGDQGPVLLNLLSRLESGLAEEGLLTRMQRERRRRRKGSIRIRAFREDDQPAFKALNLAWIRQYWTPEAEDLAALNDPWSKILDPGGCIVMAMEAQEAVGTCALIPRRQQAGEYELAKMCVSDHCKGLGIGERLGRAVLAQARSRGARSLYLETNRLLTPAIGLYRKLGFEEIDAQSSPYERADLFMRLTL